MTNCSGRKKIKVMYFVCHPSGISDRCNDTKKLDACLLLIARSLDELRYSLDRKEQNADDLFNKVQNVLSEIFSKGKKERLVNLNAVLYESLLPFTLNLNDDFFKTVSFTSCCSILKKSSVPGFR